MSSTYANVEQKNILRVDFPLDHFGVAASGLFAQLLSQTGDKRRRKSALNTIITMAKGFQLIPKEAEVVSISLLVDRAGQIMYQIQYTVIPPKTLPKAMREKLHSDMKRALDQGIGYSTGDFTDGDLNT
jgi:hypothetical protein